MAGTVKDGENAEPAAEKATRPSGERPEDWATRISELHPDTKVAGYWKAIQDNCEQWAKEITVGPYWSEVRNNLDRWSTEYRASTQADLLRVGGLSGFDFKSETSIRDKVYRICRNKPDKAKGIIGSSPTIPRLNDLVRTRVVCRYVDGVEFITSKMADLARVQTVLQGRRREGRLEGYFAQHLYLKQQVFFRYGGQQMPAEILCEVQVATEMATRMWTEGHGAYEIARGANDEPEKWQWSTNDPRFISNQLGHMLHLADGLLMQLRDSTKSRKS
ncbi:MAG TPA: hypothetical protein VMI56_00655 [Reyranella sp.]|nr:hypothetical protein [Reyranella sp.]